MIFRNNPLRTWAIFVASESLIVLTTMATSPKVRYRGHPKAWLIAGVLGIGVCVAIFAAASVYVRQTPEQRDRVFAMGAGLVLSSLVWTVISVALIYSNTQSMTLGLFSMAGIALSLPLVGVGGALLWAGRTVELREPLPTEPKV